MYLYNLTLQRATGITMAVHGSFSGTKQQVGELVMLNIKKCFGRVVLLLQMKSTHCYDITL